LGIEKGLPVQDKVAHWIQIRKDTTPVHWLYGLLCALLIFTFGILYGLVMMAVFGIMEYWNDKELRARDPSYLPEGCTDWWESFVTFSVGSGVIALFQGFGLVHVSWLTGSLF